MRFAEDLGAIIVQTSGEDVARTLITEASARHITQLVLGLPARARWEELLSGSVINRVLRLNTEMRIHLVPYKKEWRPLLDIPTQERLLCFPQHLSCVTSHHCLKRRVVLLNMSKFFLGGENTFFSHSFFFWQKRRKVSCPIMLIYMWR